MESDPISSRTLVHVISALLKAHIELDKKCTVQFALHSRMLVALSSIIPEEDVDPLDALASAKAEFAKAYRDLFKEFGATMQDLTARQETCHEQMEAVLAELEALLSSGKSGEEGKPGAEG